jgi:hypothetical protein
MVAGDAKPGHSHVHRHACHANLDPAISFSTSLLHAYKDSTTPW